ncbi:DUF2726 domain-containing protein [Caenorhabditis elegans]|uniref:DUF2726 domain-containing protein n=1 Tax=Caenorhabditis elegans TaxID=6239 RepID=O61979_CAEEL|nr:DUF2726 domain-containing protein [Caenorhabditis elegans]CCD72355.1 DUF2726 domain-containing protein [Caenorhabditis elegans]|eukprot:NP_505306.1 Uncharacterized protein CELE_H14N18.2 [Caenorhabditis elegans]
MNCALSLYFLVFLFAGFLYFRLHKIDPLKNFYVQFPDQDKCIRDLLYPYIQDRNIELFGSLPLFINQCSYKQLRSYFHSIRDGQHLSIFLPVEKGGDDDIPPHGEFLFAEDQCVIVHATERSDIKTELKMKKKWPLCKIAKVSTQATPDKTNQIEVVQAKLKLAFNEKSFSQDKSFLDLHTLMRVFLNSRYIEALYLDESVSLDEILQFSDQKSFAMLFPVCQLTVVLLQPENTSEAAEFWNFILNFVIDSPLVLVSSLQIDRNKIDMVFYNPVYKSCNFKHLSIPFKKGGVKF